MSKSEQAQKKAGTFIGRVGEFSFYEDNVHGDEVGMIAKHNPTGEFLFTDWYDIPRMCDVTPAAEFLECYR